MKFFAPGFLKTGSIQIPPAKNSEKTFVRIRYFWEKLKGKADRAFLCSNYTNFIEKRTSSVSKKKYQSIHIFFFK